MKVSVSAIHEVLTERGPSRSADGVPRDLLRRCRAHDGTVEVDDEVAALFADLAEGAHVEDTGTIRLLMDHEREEALIAEAKAGAASTCDETFMGDWEGLFVAVHDMREQRVALGLSLADWVIV